MVSDSLLVYVACRAKDRELHIMILGAERLWWRGKPPRTLTGPAAAKRHGTPEPATAQPDSRQSRHRVTKGPDSGMSTPGQGQKNASSQDDEGAAPMPRRGVRGLSGDAKIRTQCGSHAGKTKRLIRLQY